MNSYPHIAKGKTEVQGGISKCSLWLCYVADGRTNQHKTVN